MEVPICGGFNKVQPADDEIIPLVAQVKNETEAKLGKTFSVFEAVSYNFQIVGGKNYKVKVKVGENEYVHVKIYKKLQAHGNNIELTKAEGGKTLADAL